MKMNQVRKALPFAGFSVAAGAAALMMMHPRKKSSVQKTAGRALKAVGDAVEHYHGNFKI